MDFVIFAAFVVAMATILLWLTQLIDLLGRRDSEFPSDSDRIIWAMVIILVPGLGALLYLFMKPLRAAPSSEALERELDRIRRDLADRNPPDAAG